MSFFLIIIIKHMIKLFKAKQKIFSDFPEIFSIDFLMFCVIILLKENVLPVHLP